jgi:hypothetical protein
LFAWGFFCNRNFLKYRSAIAFVLSVFGGGVEGIEFELGAFSCAKQALYPLSHISSSFCSGDFGDGGLMNYLPGLTLNHDPPPDLSLPNNQDYIHELQAPNCL